MHSKRATGIKRGQHPRCCRAEMKTGHRSIRIQPLNGTPASTGRRIPGIERRYGFEPAPVRDGLLLGVCVAFA
jgi:hypothetical protein